MPISPGRVCSCPARGATVSIFATRGPRAWTITSSSDARGSSHPKWSARRSAARIVPKRRSPFSPIYSASPGARERGCRRATSSCACRARTRRRWRARVPTSTSAALCGSARRAASACSARRSRETTRARVTACCFRITACCGTSASRLASIQRTGSRAQIFCGACATFTSFGAKGSTRSTQRRMCRSDFSSACSSAAAWRC